VRRKEFLTLSGPTVLLMAALLLVPLVTTVVWSFQNVPVGQPGTFTGFSNYGELLSSSRFLHAGAFTVGYAVAATVLKVALGYVLALLLARVRRGRTVLLSFLLASYIVPSVVGALDFSWLFNDVFGGVVNRALGVVGVQVDWLVDTWPARGLVVLHALWHEIPFVVLVLLAGLQTLPEEPMEAASLDGANWWQKQRFLVVPALAPVFSFVLLISLMDGLKVFDSIRIMTPAAEQLGTESLMTYVYQVALGDSFRLGMGSAVNVLTMVVTILLLIPFLRSTWKGARAL
jgi:N,N'-diacetylchitobiose transport system permease protein